MKNIYRNAVRTVVILVMLIPLFAQAQTIRLTFANAENTNDGTDDYYEADIYIETADGLADFKVGSGQIYFNYNTLAFGENVKANGNFEVIATNPDYLVGQYIDAAPANIYGTQVINDNITSRVSWAFLQSFSSSTFAVNNVTSTPVKLMRVKFKYIDVNELPDVSFVNDNAELSMAVDQFFTACGSAGGGMFDAADCTNYQGTQIMGGIYENGGAVLSTDNVNLVAGISLYPNPASDMVYIKSAHQIRQVEVYNGIGQVVFKQKGNTETIDISHLESAMYFVKLSTDSASKTIKLIKK